MVGRMEDYIMKYSLFITLVCLCMFCTSVIGSEGSNAMVDKGLIQYKDVIKVDVNAGGPSYLEHQKYNYTTSSKNEIAYILNYLNNFKLEDDGKTLNSNDGSSYSIKIFMNDGSTKKCGFDSGRFYNDSNKQYAIDCNEYQRFLDFIYALKTSKIILEDVVTFEPSEWAIEDIEKAIENGLVPSFNQINYKGKLNRLEVCQFIANFFESCGYTADITEPNPFTDTSDKSVLALYHLKILNGKSETLFCPYDWITREEFAKILSNTYYLVKNDTTIDSKKISYKDQEKVSDWAKDSVSNMTSLGLFNGNENDEFEPQKDITKEEVIITLLRLANVLSINK